MPDAETGLIPIGRFSALCRISVVTLRHYAEVGVLTPAWVDPGSGYRYYRPAQVQQATTIRLLRELDLGLERIADLLAAGPTEATAALREQVEALEQRSLDQRRVAAYLIMRLTQQEDVMEITVQTRTEPQQVALMRSRTVTIGDLHSFLGSAFSELETEAAARGLTVVPGAAFARFHGRVDEEHSDTVDACVVVAAEPGAPGTVTLPQALVATAHLYGEQAAYPALLGAYDAVARWAGEHGHELVEPAREVYRELVAHGDARDHFEIVWPLSES